MDAAGRPDSIVGADGTASVSISKTARKIPRHFCTQISGEMGFFYSFNE
jgi:hypothetical protein